MPCGCVLLNISKSPASIFYFNWRKACCVGLEMIAVFGLCQFPGFMFWITREYIETAHVLVGLIGKCQHALHIYRPCFGIIIPMNKSLVFKTRANWKNSGWRGRWSPIVFRCPKYLRTHRIHAAFAGCSKDVDCCILLPPYQCWSVLSSSFLHAGSVPCILVVSYFFFKLPQNFAVASACSRGHGIFNNDVTVVHPEVPIILLSTRNDLPLLRSFNFVALLFAVEGFPGMSVCALLGIIVVAIVRAMVAAIVCCSI